MIARLEGTLAELLRDGVLVDVGGVGYRVLMPVSALARLAERGERVSLHTSLQVREDSMTLYGFLSADERDLFETLLGVNGIGPRAALAVLSVYPPADLRRAVATEDLEALTLIPGVGKKTAARMILELRERLGSVDEAEGVPGPSSRVQSFAEVHGALEALGYSPAEVRKALDGIDADGRPVEDLLKAALKRLAKA